MKNKFYTLDWAIEEINKFSELEENWDSEGASAIEPEAIKLGLKLVDHINLRRSVAPWPVPISHGGVQLEYNVGNENIEVEISSEGKVGIYLWQAGIEHDPMPFDEFYNNIAKYTNQLL